MELLRGFPTARTMTARTLLSSTLIMAGLAAAPASAQYYYGYGPREDWGPRYAPGPYSYNAPPPVARGYDEDYAPRAPRPLSARAVVDRLEDMGYDDVGSPRFTGTLYIVVATAPGGLRQQVTVDAIRGIILNRVPMAGRPGQPRDESYDEERRPRRYGTRPLDTDDLYRERDETSPRRVAPRREAARPDPVDGPPLPPDPVLPPVLPAPADPRLSPVTPQPDPRRPASRPSEGRKATREASTEPRRTTPSEPGARPFGLNPSTPPAPKAKPAEAAKPDGGPIDAKKPVDTKKPVAEAQSRPNKPVRVIQGVTPLVNGESRSQLDNLPKPPEPAAPTGN